VRLTRINVLGLICAVLLSWVISRAALRTISPVVIRLLLPLILPSEIQEARKAIKPPYKNKSSDKGHDSCEICKPPRAL